MDYLPDTLITTYLQMTRRSDFQPAFLTDTTDVCILRMNAIDVPFYKFLYQTVGEIWRWRDRLMMPEDQLLAALSDPGCSVDVLYAAGTPAGYVELMREGDDTEVVYFGLRPAFIGRGLGKHLLSYGIDQAWKDGASRVWVHTCNLDGPYALANYQKRGFGVYKVDEQPMPTRYA